MDNSLYKPIIEFFEGRKEKKELDFPTYEEKLIAVKNILKTWLVDTAKKVGQMKVSTHPCTFTHPSANTNKVILSVKNKSGKLRNRKEQIKTTPIVANAPKANDGYVRTGNVDDLVLDALGNAGAMAFYKFINLELLDNKTILEHVENDTDVAKELFSNTNELTYEELKEGFLSVKANDEPLATSPKLKQVYFPVEDDYHLLSVVMPSGIMNKLKLKINDMKFSEETKELRKLRQSNSYTENQLQDLYDLTMIGYGSTKPQMVSLLNNENAGRFYHINSLPPLLTKRNVRPPKTNFFANSIWPNAYKESFNSLHNLLKIDVNNLNVRRGRDNIILFIMEDIIRKTWAIRGIKPGWSDAEQFNSLPRYQKFLLDNLYEQDRLDDKDYMEKAITEFTLETTRWLINSYKRVMGSKAIILVDDELKYINNLILAESEASL